MNYKHLPDSDSVADSIKQNFKLMKGAHHILNNNFFL